MELLAQLSASLGDRYQIEREIGRGGMAVVYLARDVKHNRKVALKVLNPELGAVLGVERFLAEIQVTAHLQHPNLLPLFDSGEADGLLFYVMPYVEGESLRARLNREKQLSVEEAVRLTVAVAGALDYAHRHQVVHRDLKPENILLHEGQPLVADFGIALAVSNAGGARITQTGLSLGTPQYMSPEQATGDRAIDGRTDVYSLGAVLYEMLAGEPPHTGGTAQAIIARVITDRPRPLRVARASVPPHIDAAVERALEKLSADRWATAHDFALGLEGKAAVPEHGRTAVASSSATASSRWRARAHDPIVLLLAIAAIAGGVNAARGALARGSTRPDEHAVRFDIVLPPGVSQAPLLGREIAFSRDGQTVVFAAVGNKGQRQLFVRRLADRDARPLDGTTNASNPFFSPDGRWVGFLDGLSLRKVSLDGGAALPVTEMPPGEQSTFGFTWSPNGQVIVTVEGVLGAVPATGGALRKITQLDGARGEISHRWPIALSDGRTVLYASYGAAGGGGASNARIAVASLAGERTTILDLPGAAPLGMVDGQLIYVTASNAVMAVPFDVDQRRVLDQPRPILTNVVVRPTGAARVAVSDNGSIAFESASPLAELVLMDEHGAIRPLLSEPGVYMNPRFSPDGRRLAFTGATQDRSDVWLYDLATKTSSRFTTDGIGNERPEWSPDGTRVLYLSRRKTAAIYWKASDLSRAAEPLLESQSLNYYEGVISPDGKYLAFQLDSIGAGTADVYVKALSGDTMPYAVSATPFSETHPRISPDGRWIAYVSDESGKRQVIVQPFPAGGGRVQVSPDGGDEPVWSRDAKHLYYRDGDQMISVAYTGSPFFTVVARTSLFSGNFAYSPLPHANYDVAPDGHAFVMVRPIQEQRITVIHNWRVQLGDARATQRAK